MHRISIYKKNMAIRGNPYFELVARRPFREARLRAYIVRQHRSGRRLSEILSDPYLQRFGNASLVEAVLSDPVTIRALGQDVRDAIENGLPETASP